MSTAIINSPIFECSELFKDATASKVKEAGQPAPTAPTQGAVNPCNEHSPLKRSYTSLVSLIEQHRKLDRSVSEPTSRYKTELCRPFEESGSCKYGDKCQFAHGYSELRNLARHPKYKTELCRTFHKIGFCPYGPRCHFVHNFEEARIHNLKVSAQLGQPQPSLAALGPLLQPTSALNTSLLEQLAASPQMAAAALVRANSLNLAAVAAAAAAATATSSTSTTTTTDVSSSSSSPPPLFVQQHQPLYRSTSIGQQQQKQHHHSVGSSSILIGGIGRPPKPLNLSPTFSLGSAADSISPSSSLSQSPTNSMASFFSDETGLPTTAFSFGQDFGLLGNSRQSPSPQMVFEEQSPRTPSPHALNPESRLPVFNRISKTLTQLDNLRLEPRKPASRLQ